MMALSFVFFAAILQSAWHDFMYHHSLSKMTWNPYSAMHVKYAKDDAERCAYALIGALGSAAVIAVCLRYIF